MVQDPGHWAAQQPRLGRGKAAVVLAILFLAPLSGSPLAGRGWGQDASKRGDAAAPQSPPAACQVGQLNESNWSAWVPAGKEVDCIYGDWVLRNGQLVAIIGHPRPGRNANMTVRDVGGCLIDLTSVAAPNDQLSAFYPGAGRYSFSEPPQVARASATDCQLIFRSVPHTKFGTLTISYGLTADAPQLRVATEITNTTKQVIEVELADAIRADRTFQFGAAVDGHLFWADDEWFGQAYGVYSPDRQVTFTGKRGVVVRYRTGGGDQPLKLAPGDQVRWERLVYPANHLLAVKGMAEKLAAQATCATSLAVRDPAGPVARAQVELRRGDESYGTGRTDEHGRIAFLLPQGSYTAVVRGLGRPEVSVPLNAEQTELARTIELAGCGYVTGKVIDSQGRPTPCKVAFHGIDGTEDPYFGPDSAAVGVRNVHYSHNGVFRQEIGPGTYQVLISRGPEFDLESRRLTVTASQESPLEVELRRTVDTRGWISADFHSHSSPSGDNTGSQRGRVLNLLAEHVEFAPCTEHNRISTYVPHLQALKATELMATCSGMELTGSPLPINHQNAFPLKLTPRTQDGGGPITDANPVVQIARLAMWDDQAPKLVQANHPNLVQILGDKNLDGKQDEGFAGMLPHMDVIEVHPPAGIFTPPTRDRGGQLGRNPIFHWMQMLNLGYRIPGVVNTDAHYNYHESGWLRNYLKSDTDAPREIEVAEVVQASERGNVVMTNGPFLEVWAGSENDRNQATCGDELRASDGRVELTIRVQCANWLDINRVQIFVNGRPRKELNFTRREAPDKFGQSVVKFNQKLTVELSGDAHLIVAAAGEGLKLGQVMGPRFGEDMPIAVSNPIFVDVDGAGFQANGDLLDLPIPAHPPRSK